MSRSNWSALLSVVAVAAVGGLPLACQSGGVGDPCTPEDEYDAGFAGFKVTEENVESRSFQCATRICLVNHFQGRVSCPLGQAAPTPCRPENGGGECRPGEACVEAGTLASHCAADLDCPPGFLCDPRAHACKSYVCHAPGDCQTADGTSNGGKACCLPATDTPVAREVCGQCAVASKRAADAAVYCSCRCGVAEGDPGDPAFNFCACPSGFECAEIRHDVGLGDAHATGKYCVKSGSAYPNDNGVSCGAVAGHMGGSCSGLPGAL